MIQGLAPRNRRVAVFHTAISTFFDLCSRVELVDIYHGWLLPGQLYRGDIFEYMAEAVTSSSLSDPTPTFARRGVTHTTEFVS